MVHEPPCVYREIKNVQTVYKKAKNKMPTHKYPKDKKDFERNLGFLMFPLCYI